MKLDDIKIRIDELINKGNQLLASTFRNRDGFERIDTSVYTGLKTATLSLILKVYDKSHPYYTEIENITHYEYPSAAKNLLNVLISIREEITGGWLFTTKGLVSSEIFSDFLEMADHLLNENYKDPAAVVIGSVLEEHLRQLCLKNSIDIEVEKNDKKFPKKADSLNSDLASGQVYNKLDQKSVTAWFDLRNKAAHGKYDDYSKEQVMYMYSGVIDFMTRNGI